MSFEVCYVERHPGKFVSLEKAFREIASGLGPEFSSEFVQLPFSSRVYDSLRNLIFFKRPSADLYHITGQINYIGLRLPADRTVLSIMDVRFVNMNRGLKRAILKKLYLDLPVRHAKYVTAISENVKREIVELTGCPERKIRVLDLPLLSHIRPDKTRAFNADCPHILQVGTMENKNILRLADALKRIKCKLVVVGELSTPQSDALTKNNIQFSNPIGVSDQEMAQLYQEADIVSFCSTYEGFGLPIIEAQVMGKPVITSHLSPMKETAGDGACLVDPFDAESIRDGFEIMMNDHEYRESVIRKGIENCQRFSSEKVAAQYAGLYREILASKRTVESPSAGNA